MRENILHFQFRRVSVITGKMHFAQYRNIAWFCGQVNQVEHLKELNSTQRNLDKSERRYSVAGHKNREK